VKLTNLPPGKAGLWLFQIGDRQEYDNFEVSRTLFKPVPPDSSASARHVVSENFKSPNVPSPQDWVLVLERVKAATP
jgi:hypothetical protein